MASLGKKRRVSPERRLVCPDLAPSSLIGPVRTFDLDQLERVAARFGAGYDTFGLELKVAYLLEASGHDDEQLRRPYYRLAQEPIIWSWWDALQQCPMESADMLALASLLNGEPVACRAREIVSLRGASDGHLFYETVAQGRAWLADIAAVEGLPGDPIRKALYRFARIIMAHPFTDANGRFARAALQSGLARHGLIATPCLALAPTFYLRAGDIRATLRALSDDGCWDDYFERMGDVLAEAVERVEVTD